MKLCQRGVALLLCFGDPAGHDGRIGTVIERFECGPVPGELAVAFGDGPARQGRGGIVAVPALGGNDGGDGLGPAVRAEVASQPAVERGKQSILAQVDVAGMMETVGQGVLVREPAPVVRGTVVLLTLHPPVADPAEQDPTQNIRVAVTMGLVTRRSPPSGGEQFLSGGEGLIVDDLRVDDVVRPDPGVLGVPDLLGLVSERDVVYVDEDFALALFVPDLPAGVAGIDQDRPDGALGPGDPAPVPVPRRIIGRRRQDPVGGQAFGDGEEALPTEELGEDAPDDLGGVRVDLQHVQTLAVGSLARIGMWPGIDQPIPVWRAPADVPVGGLGHRRHRGAHPRLDPRAFAFADRPERRHDHVVGLVGRVDRPIDLWHPQRHAIVLEQREGVAELVAVERPLRFTDDHGIPSAIRVDQLGEQQAGLRSTGGRDRPGLVDIEVLGHDLPAPRCDELLSTGVLPGA